VFPLYRSKYNKRVNHNHNNNNNNNNKQQQQVAHWSNHVVQLAVPMQHHREMYWLPSLCGMATFRREPRS
jgi:hypothetical protein